MRRLVLLLVLATGIPFLWVLLQGHTLGPWDQVGPMASLTGQRAESTKAWDVLQADACLQFYPWRDLVFESWGTGRVPFWNPYSLCGTPLLANSQSGGFYPPHIVWGILQGLFGTAVFSTGLGILLLAWFHSAAAAAGIAFAGRRMGGDATVCTIAGIAFGLSPFFMAWAPLGSVVATVAWMPWCVGFGLGLIRDGKMGDAAGLAVSVALMLLAGHLQFAAFGLIGLATLLLCVGIGQRAFGQLAVAAGCVLIGAMLAAPQVLPVLRFSEQSHRRTVASDEGFATYRRTSLGGAELVALIDPRLLGDPQTVDPDAPIAGISKFEPLRTIPGANYAEFAVGLGLVLLVMVAFVRRVDRLVAVGLGLVAVIGVLFAVGHPALRVLYFGLPGWSSTGSPTRGGVLFLLAGALLATQMRRPAHAAGPGLLIGACVLLSFWVPVRSGKFPDLANETTEPGRSAAMNAKWSLAVTPQAVLPPNTMSLRRHGGRMMDFGGYDSLMSRDTVEFLRAVNGSDPAPPENGNMMFVKPTVNAEMLAAAGVNRIYVPTPDGPAVIPVADPAPYIRLGDAPVPTWRRWPGGKIEFEAEGEGRLVVLERHMAGWQAMVDGKPVPTENSDGWLSVPSVAPGRHRVELFYVAPGYREGLVMCGAAMLGLAALFVRQKLAFRPAE